jgi:hypothetical protein
MWWLGFEERSVRIGGGRKRPPPNLPLSLSLRATIAKKRSLLPHTRRRMASLKEICPRGNNIIIIIIFLVHDNVYITC